MTPKKLSIFFCGALGLVASVPMAQAVVTRNSKMKGQLGILFVLSWLGLGVSTGIDEHWHLRSGGMVMALAMVGAQFIVLSMKVLWMHRKMGDTWEVCWGRAGLLLHSVFFRLLIICVSISTLE